MRKVVQERRVGPRAEREIRMKKKRQKPEPKPRSVVSGRKLTKKEKEIVDALARAMGMGK